MVCTFSSSYVIYGCFLNFSIPNMQKKEKKKEAMLDSREQGVVND